MGSPLTYRRDLRYWILISLIAATAVFIGFRYYVAASEGGQQTAVREQRKERGRILDRNGVVLAVDSSIFHIGVQRTTIDRETFSRYAAGLAEALGWKPSDLLARWDESRTDFLYFDKAALPQTARRVEEFRSRLRKEAQETQDSAVSKMHQKMIGALIIDEIPGRLYPEGRLASHLVGFVGSEHRGLEGIEMRYDAELSAPQSSVPNAVITEATSLSSRGNDVVLTIDADLQYMLEQLARRTRSTHGAESVMILVQDVRTGELLAYVCMPDFDPNTFGSSSAEDRRDLPATYAYEPGSVFKVYSLASILDTGAITIHTPFECDGDYVMITAGGEKIVIKDLNSYGTLTLDGVLAHSSNVGTALAADRIDATELYQRLKLFGFGGKLGVTLALESWGSLREVREWSARSKPTIAFGQELTATALQMVNAAATVGNMGKRMKPYVVGTVVRPDGRILYGFGPKFETQVIKESTARNILSAMESAASMEGTGWRAKIDDVRMAVKTGTAQMVDLATKRYSDKDYIASTLAILPADDPRVAVYVAIVKPRGEQYLGGRIAAPVVKEAAEAVLSVIDIPRARTPEVRHSGAIRPEKTVAVQIGQTMPDLKGQPKRAFLPLLGRLDLRIVMTGEGYLIRQSPEPGTPVPSGSSIILEFQ